MKHRRSLYLAHGLIVNPMFARADRPHGLAKWLPSRNSPFKSSVALRKRRKPLREQIWTTMESKGPTGHNPFTSMDAEKQSLSQIASGRIRPKGTRGGRGRQIRQQRQREGDRRPRWCRLEVHAASVHDFFDWSSLFKNSNVKALEKDRPAKSVNLLFSKNHRGWRG